MEENIEKLYYKIGEVAEMLNVAPSLLRFWEKEIEWIKPVKNKKGDRSYTRKDLEIIKTVYNLTKERGYTLQGAKEVIRRQGLKETEKVQVLETLKNMKAFLLEIKEQL